MKRVGIILFLICGLLCLTFGGGFLKLQSWALDPHPIKDSVIIVLEKGERLKDISAKLESSGVISHAGFFSAYIKIRGVYEKFQAGRYRFEGQLAPKDVVQTMIEGRIFQNLTLEFNIPEGATIDQITDKLSRIGYPESRQFQEIAKSPQTPMIYGFKSTSLEGFLFPATYRFYETLPKPKDILEQAIQEFRKRLPAQYADKLREKGLSLEQGVIFASLIERETLLDDERHLISEIIWKRLKRREPLGIDATIIYGIKDYAGDLKTKHLKDASNLYNSRIHKGLPPTAIASPSLNSLVAVLNPSETGFYYYVLTPGTVRHQFSKTLDEHNSFVRKLVKAQRP